MSIIYHYTSISGLALILNHRTIRMNCLNRVDDKEEGQTEDMGNLSSYIFVSSWTNSNEENIALWNMYSHDMKGVRIGLPSDLLDLKMDSKEESIITNGLLVGDDAKNEIIVFAPFGYEPSNVIYIGKTQKRQFLQPNDDKASDMNWKIELKCLGLYKSKLWEFQNEVRFVFAAFPKHKTKQGFSNIFIGDVLLGMMCHEKLNLKFIDLPIKPEALSKMEILLGPACDESDQIIVDSLVKNLSNISAIKIANSSLGIRRS